MFDFIGILNLLAVNDNPKANVIWTALSSQTAILIYVVILLLTIVILVVSVVVDHARRAEEAEELDKLREQIKNGGQNADKNSNKKKDKGMKQSRFYMLTQTDNEMANHVEGDYNEEIGLEEFCDKFRNFAASRLKLYYDIREIRRFVASLAVSHIIIMQGMSGTGKTSLAYAIGEFLKNRSVIVPIQPMWKERTDLVGYYNEFTKKFNETTLLQKMYEANYSENIYVTVLDEMNIARVEYYFAEFLSLLELPKPESRYIDVVSDKWDDDPKLLRKGQLKLPENMWFIGTANNDDSTFAISDKVYDRAMIMNLDKKTQVFYAEDTESVKITYKRFTELVKKAKKDYGITGRKMRQIRELDRYMMENFHITFGNRIMKQLKEYVSAYVSCGGSEEEAIDDMVAKKIMRKLETQNPVYVRNSIDGLLATIEEVFGQDKMEITKEYLRHLERTM